MWREAPKDIGLVLEHVFDVRIDFHQRLIFDPMPGGQRAAYTSVKSGTVSGPRLNGKVNSPLILPSEGLTCSMGV